MYLHFALFAFIASVTPGPANIALLTGASRGQLRELVRYSAGILCGFALVLVIAAILFQAGVSMAGPALLWLKIIGCLYFLWLAWQILNAPLPDGTADDQGNTAQRFTAGLLVHPLSYKAWLFVLLSYGTFVGNSGNIDLCALIFLLAALISMIPWAVAGYLLKCYTPPATLKWVNVLSALSILALVAWIGIGS